MPSATEEDIVAWLRAGKAELLSTATFIWEDAQEDGVDGYLTATVGPHQQRFVVEINRLNTPKAIQTTVMVALDRLKHSGLRLLVVVPYLSEERLDALESMQVSGLDMCGNGLLIGSNFIIKRSGAANRFPASKPIRNVFRGNSSIFARCFALCPEFSSLKALHEYAVERALQATLAVGTASKVVQALEQELLIRRKGRALLLQDFEGLLARLLREFSRAEGRKIVGKTALDGPEVWTVLRREQAAGRLRSVVTGSGSAGKYGVLSGGNLTLYVSDIKQAVDVLSVKETLVFPTLELIEEPGDVVYFDARQEEKAWAWASPIQTWLELASGGPRERQAAESFKTSLRAQNAGTAPKVVPDRRQIRRLSQAIEPL